MRFLNVAFVMSALTVSTSYVQAQEGISPEVFAACEAKTPNDYKQQLACVKEQADALNALNDLKKTKSRQIVVQPKAEDVDDADTASEPVVATVPAQAPGFEATSAEAYCKGQILDSSDKVNWRVCLENETAAHGDLAEAIASVDSDIPGDPYEACRNYITAFEPLAKSAYVSQVQMLKCLKAKAPTRDFGRCYQNYEHRIFTRQVTSVSAETADHVANCFASSLEGGP